MQGLRHLSVKRTTGGGKVRKSTVPGLVILTWGNRVKGSGEQDLSGSCGDSVETNLVRDDL